MSEQVAQAQARTVAGINARAEQPPMRVTIKGRCERVRRHEQKVYTTVMIPAVDEYSRPNMVEIRSGSRFAEPGDPVQVQATLGGYGGRAYTVTDRDGERRTVHPVNLTLDLVE